MLELVLEIGCGLLKGKTSGAKKGVTTKSARGSVGTKVRKTGTSRRPESWVWANAGIRGRFSSYTAHWVATPKKGAGLLVLRSREVTSHFLDCVHMRFLKTKENEQNYMKRFNNCCIRI